MINLKNNSNNSEQPINGNSDQNIENNLNPDQPLITGETRQEIIDNEHLKLLSIGYMVSAGTTAFFSLIGLFYVVVGVFLSSDLMKKANQGTNQQGPEAAGWILSIMGGLMFIFFAIFAVLKLKVAFCIKKRQGRVFCMIIAGFSCLGFPYGSLLGVFTFMALERPTVRKLFISK